MDLLRGCCSSSSELLEYSTYVDVSEKFKFIFYENRKIFIKYIKVQTFPSARCWPTWSSTICLKHKISITKTLFIFSNSLYSILTHYRDLLWTVVSVPVRTPPLLLLPLLHLHFRFPLHRWLSQLYAEPANVNRLWSLLIYSAFEFSG